MTTPVSNVWELQSCVQQAHILFLLLPHSDDAPPEEKWGTLFEGFAGPRSPHRPKVMHAGAPRGEPPAKGGPAISAPQLQRAAFRPATWAALLSSQESPALDSGVLLTSVITASELLQAARTNLQGVEPAVLDLRCWSETSEALACAVLRVSHLARSVPGAMFGLLLENDPKTNGSARPSSGTSVRSFAEAKFLVSFPEPATDDLWLNFAQWRASHPHQDADADPVAVDLAEFVKGVPAALKGFHLPQLNELQVEAVRLARIISRLRAPAGCPWDREQTISSLRPYLIEEAYEAFEAASDWAAGNLAASAAFCDELGDVLLQIVLNAQIAAEMGAFTLNDVFRTLSEKMVRRHPHVFDPGSASLSSADDVRVAWDRIKASEPGGADPRGPGENGSAQQAPRKSLLHKALKKKSLPTLEYVTAVSKRSTRVGFCWPTLKDTWQDILNEVNELEQEIHAPSVDWTAVEDEMGDVVFALANVLVHAREKMGAPESLTLDAAVRRATSKFVNRFAEMETIYREEQHHELDEQHARQLDLARWDDLWKKAKKRRYR